MMKEIPINEGKRKVKAEENNSTHNQPFPEKGEARNRPLPFSSCDEPDIVRSLKVNIVITVWENFNLERAVCNHGFFMMAPNCWIPSHKSLMRPLSLEEDHNNNNNSKKSQSTIVSITQPPNKNFLIIKPLQQHHHLSCENRESIRCQVERMLHISAEDEMMMQEFHRIYPKAKEVGFGFIFRSPTLFEDIVKSVLLCYCPWGRSLDMAEALCNLEQKLLFGKKGMKSKRKRHGSSSSSSSSSSMNNNNNDDEYAAGGWRLRWGGCMSNFPSSKQIACLDEKTLNQYCNLGYRASLIIQIAKDIQSGILKLEDFQAPPHHQSSSHHHHHHHKLLRDRLFNINGFGSFTVANIMMCIGFYQHIPVDTETIKHLEQVHGRTTKLNTKTQIQLLSEIYDKYAPFQCLAYWMERVEYYEKKLGKLSELPHTKYCHATTTKT